MHVEVVESGPCSRTVTIKVPADRVRKHLDDMFASANQQVQMKGFRPGKVPRKVLEKRLGESITGQAKEQLVNQMFGDACREKQLVPVGRAHIENFEALVLAAGSPLEFQVKVDVKPEFELKDPKGIEVEAFDPVANETDVDNALKEVSNQKRSIKKVDEPAQDGDFVKSDLTFVDESGATVHERKGVQLNTRIPVAGTAAEAFAKALVGATAGQQIELDLTFPANFEKEAVRGKAGKLRIAVLEVLRVAGAPIDDELAKSLEFENLAALRADLLVRIGHEKERVGKLRQEELCLQHLLSNHEFPLPETLVTEQAQASLMNFARRLEQNGTGKEEIEQKVEESKAEARTDAERRVKLFFLIDAVARQEKMAVTDEDMWREIQAVAQQNNATPQQVVEYLQQNNQVNELRLALMERKVREFLRTNARIVDKKA